MWETKKPFRTQFSKKKSTIQPLLYSAHILFFFFCLFLYYFVRIIIYLKNANMWTRLIISTWPPLSLSIYKYICILVERFLGNINSKTKKKQRSKWHKKRRKNEKVLDKMLDEEIYSWRFFLHCTITGNDNITIVYYYYYLLLLFVWLLCIVL